MKVSSRCGLAFNDGQDIGFAHDQNFFAVDFLLFNAVAVFENHRIANFYIQRAHVAVVEVDRDTGLVKHLRHIACDDAGTMVNPMLLAGQVHGGVAQGTGQALYEGVRYDSDGNPVTSNLADYTMISADLMPTIERIPMETPTFVNPLGAKGIGESGTIGSTPAVHSAVIDALSHLGVRHIDMPCTPEKVWQAMNAAS